MTTYLISSLAGRIAVVLSVFVILLPYFLRRNRLSRSHLSQGLGLAQDRTIPYLRRLWPHFWLGYLILALSTLHAGTVMAAMSRANPTGVWAATVAFLLLLLEIMLGLGLRSVDLVGRKSFRQFHFWTMTAFVAALGVHLWLNAR